MSTTALPVIITEEAATQVASFGMEKELVAMIDWVRSFVPDLRGILVRPGNNFSRPDRPSFVVICAHREVPNGKPPTDLVEWDWAGWKAVTFPPAVCARFTMACRFEPLPAPEPRRGAGEVSVSSGQHLP